MNKVIFELEIYTYQIDFVGHVSNIVYIEWMEIGRLKLLDFIGLPISKLSEKGIAPILVHTDIRYKKALYVEDKVRVEVWVSELKNVSAKINFNFYNSKGELAAFGSQQGLFIHRETVRPYRLGEAERQAFKKVLLI